MYCSQCVFLKIIFYIDMDALTGGHKEHHGVKDPVGNSLCVTDICACSSHTNTFLASSEKKYMFYLCTVS